MRDELKLINSSNESEEIARSVPDTNGIYLVPVFVGLGAPYWDFNAEGIITGITRGTNKAHIVRAGLESIVYEVNDVIMAMEKDLNIELSEIIAAVANDFLMVFQSDISNVEIVRPINRGVTALGIFYLAALGIGIFKDINELKKLNSIDKKFSPFMSEKIRKNKLIGLSKAIMKSKFSC